MLSTLRQVIARIRALFGSTIDRDFADELESHLDMLTEEYVRRGIEPGEARRRAAIRVGNPTSLRMQHRDARSFRIAGEFFADVKYGIRTMARTPTVAVTAIVSLALGIGATTAIFTVVNAILLRPLPFPDAHELIGVAQQHPQFGLEFATLPDFQDWREHNSTLGAIGGAWNAAFNMSGGDEPERLTGAFVTPGFFETFNIVPAAGTVFNADPSGDPLVVVLGDGLWRRRFNASPDVIGRSIQLNNRAFTVVGVMPMGFSWPAGTELWMPLVPEQSMNRGYHMLQVAARLKPDVTIEHAKADLSAIAAASAGEYPATNKDWGVRAESLLDATVASASGSLWIISGAAACLLLIACANVASLLASRAVSRRLELALRSALGASRHRLLRQLLTESLVLAAVAGGAGLLIASLSIDPLVSLTMLPRSGEIAIDWRVFAATVVVSIAAACAIGLLSGWHASGADLRDVQANRSTARTGWLRPSLLIAEVAVSVVLLTGSGLLMRSFSRLQQVDAGFDASHLLTMRFFLPRAGYPADRVARMYEDMIERMRTVPGVSDAAAVSAFPFAGATPNVVFAIPSQPEPAPGQGPSADFASITPAYFKTIGLRLLAGRDFTAADSASAPLVAIVTKSMADTFFPGQGAIGQTIRILGPRPRTIVGIVSDTRQRTLDRGPQPQIYLPHAQQPLGGMFLVVRAASDRPERLINETRAQIRSLDPTLPIASVMTADQLMGNTLSARRFTLVLITIFSAAALALAMVGIYGVLSFAVSQRQSEIGIRMALGAAQARVVSLMMWQGMWPVVLGLVIGLAAAAGTTRVLSSFLFEISERDPLTLAAVSTILMITAAVAAFLPARRASHVDPRIALN